MSAEASTVIAYSVVGAVIAVIAAFAAITVFLAKRRRRTLGLKKRR